MIIDVHAHIFPEVKGETATGPTRSIGYGQVVHGNEIIQILPPYGERTIFTPEMMIANLDWAGVAKAVLLQGPFYGECNQYAAEAIRRYPDRLTGAAFLDPWRSDCRKMFSEILDSQVFKAVKLECTTDTGLFGLHPGARLNDPEIAWIWTELERQRMALVLDLGTADTEAYQTDAVRQIAQKYPDLKVVICHLAQPKLKIEADAQLWALWQEQIDLGKLANVWFDCAALPAYPPHEDYPYPRVERSLRIAIERIGPSKIMWGTDQPGLLSHVSLPQMVKMIHLHTAFLSPDEQALILWKNAWQVYWD